MHRYNFDLPTTIRFRQLIDEYGSMRRLENMTPQRCGQRLNDFVSELADLAESMAGCNRPPLPDLPERY